MATIIRKELIKIKNGDLNKLCRKNKETINNIAKTLNLNSDHLYKFDRGEKTIQFKVWQKITNHLEDVCKQH